MSKNYYNTKINYFYITNIKQASSQIALHLADMGSLIEDETGCPSGGLLSAYSVEKVGLGCHGGKVGV